MDFGFRRAGVKVSPVRGTRSRRPRCLRSGLLTDAEGGLVEMRVNRQLSCFLPRVYSEREKEREGQTKFNI